MRLRRLFGRDPGSVEDGAREDEDAAGAQSATDGVDEPAVSADLDDEDSGRGVTDDLGDDPATDGGTDTSEAPEGGPARGEPPAPRAVNVGAEDLDEGSADDGEPTTDPGLVDRARDEPGADAVGADDGTADADTGDDATSDDRAVADAGTADAGTADAGTSDDRAVADAGRGDADHLRDQSSPIRTDADRNHAGGRYHRPDLPVRLSGRYHHRRYSRHERYYPGT